MNNCIVKNLEKSTSVDAEWREATSSPVYRHGRIRRKNPIQEEGSKWPCVWCAV